MTLLYSKYDSTYVFKIIETFQKKGLQAKSLNVVRFSGFYVMFVFPKLRLS